MRFARLVVAGLVSTALLSPSLPAMAAQSKPAQIDEIVQAAMKREHLRAVIVQVTKGDRVVSTKAFGESMDGVPASTDMRFRNGAVAFAYVSTLLLEYVDQGKVKLSDTIDKWLPSVPNSDKVTLKMLANQTSGYPDYERDPAWEKDYIDNPFRIWTYKQRRKVAFSKPVLFAPGTNWSYSHTNFMLLGKILSEIGGKPLAKLLRRNVLTPMGLKDTVANQTSEIPIAGAARVLVGATWRVGSGARCELLRGVDVLEHCVGNARWCYPDLDDRRHDQDRPRGRDRAVAVQEELPGYDRVAPHRFRTAAGQLHPVVLPAGRGLQLRVGHCAFG